MPKKKGEPVTPVTHPDPKVWKWCKHKGCKEYAVFLEDYCWEHLSSKIKQRYRNKIGKLIRKGYSLKGANFYQVNFQKANFRGGDFRKADLEKTVFQEAILEYADLGEANCTSVNFSGAHLGGANFIETLLAGAVWEGARYLHWSDIKKVGDEKKENVDTQGWWLPRSAYRRLKNYFHQEGKYSDESKAYYREKLMAKHEAFIEWFKGYRFPKKGIVRLLKDKKVIRLPYGGKNLGKFKLSLADRIKAFFSWFGLWFFHIFTGFGERWWWTVLWALGIIAFFGGVYWVGTDILKWFLFDFKPNMIASIFQYFYLSVVTFATLGFGDITPLNWQAQIPVVIEVIMGYVFLGLIITIIARRFGR